MLKSHWILDPVLKWYFGRIGLSRPKPEKKKKMSKRETSCGIRLVQD